MSILNKNESKVRESLLNSIALLEYQLAGGKITVCPSKKVKVSRRVKVKQQFTAGPSIPKNRPVSMFDRMDERNSHGGWNNW